ncbi:hypothetical protein C0Q70_05347 [Pomacea canaliculata]|uniref:Uncharacterized protein n=1 Tax=Pomacea canaliculata TaxID=400727 RepID=A0A2T7PKY0_POMCA|nr:hypothetical protein C0Q70_05347 [Pomacea canaliculata]
MNRAALHRIDLARSLFVACTQVSTSSGHGESRNLRTARDLLTSGLEHRTFQRKPLPHKAVGTVSLGPVGSTSPSLGVNAK